jgi:branched-subunit amino acid transport protein
VNGWGDGYAWAAIGAITLATFLTRSTVHVLGAGRRLPPPLEAALRYAPACALAAIVMPDLLYSGGSLVPALENPRLAGGLAGASLCALWRSPLATIGGGMAVFWIAKAFMN